MAHKISIRRIKDCSGCPHRGHSGAFIHGGAIPLCTKIGGHGSKVGNLPNRFASVLPFGAQVDGRGVPHRVATNVIPDWCPLPDEKNPTAKIPVETDELVMTQAALLAFREQMKGKQYGKNETQDAWAWFSAGWHARGSRS